MSVGFYPVLVNLYSVILNSTVLTLPAEENQKKLFTLYVAFGTKPLLSVVTVRQRPRLVLNMGGFAFTTVLSILSPRMTCCFSAVECSGGWPAMNRVPTGER